MPGFEKRHPAISLLLKLSPLHKVLFSLILPAIAFFVLRPYELDTLLLTVLLWDLFALSFTLMSWLIFFHRTTDEIRKLAQSDDGSRIFVSLIVVLASFASMVTVLLLILSNDNGNAALYLPVAICGILFSWAMVHTTYTTHYAHLYYDDGEEDSTKHAAGLNFPKEKKPDYIDFAYFAFVIGMTFQVSDVEIESRVIRRTALIHGLLSFALNTFIVALTINLVAGLKK